MFPNAKKGISKVFVSEILYLIGTILATVSAVSVILSAADNAGGSFLFGLIFLLISSILIIVAGIIQIVGLANAAKESNMFRYALFMVILSLVLTLLSALIKDYSVRDFLYGTFAPNYIIVNISDALSKVLSLVVMFFVIGGINELIPDSEVAKKSKKIVILAIITALVSVILNLITNFSSVAVATTGVILSLGALVCSLIYYIMYLVLLAMAKKAL